MTSPCALRIAGDSRGQQGWSSFGLGHAPAAALPSSAGGVHTECCAVEGLLHPGCRRAASMCSMRTALEAMTALRMALSMLGL